MRATTLEQAALLAAKDVRPVWFVQMDFDVTQRFCSANTTLEWNGYPWVGLGKVAAIQSVRESTELAINSLQMTISGVPVEIIALVEAEPIQGRTCTVWVGVYTENYYLSGSPFLEYRGRIDVPANREHEINEQGIIRCDLTITVENELAYGLRPKTQRRTDADHQALYPGDTFFSRMGKLPDVKDWGR